MIGLEIRGYLKKQKLSRDLISSYSGTKLTIDDITCYLSYSCNLI